MKHPPGAGGSGTIQAMSPAKTMKLTTTQLDERLMDHHMVASRTCAALVAVGVVLGALSLGGCAKPLLSPEEERSPFDRYDGIRAQYAPQYTTDEYGLRKPNLRNRLGNKD